MSSTISKRPATSHVGHDVPAWVLVTVFTTLLVLTFATVAVTWVDLGGYNVWVAMGIACIKATLVALFFMHLAYDKPFNTIVLVTTLFFIVFFIGLATIDGMQYRNDVDTFRAEHPDRIIPAIDQALNSKSATPAEKAGDAPAAASH
ncbi:cytochrome C oxidase subunit IV family protein [Planctomycetota bacterium]